MVAMHAGADLTTGTNNVFIGRGATGSTASCDAQVVLGFEAAGASNSSLTFGKVATDSTIAFGEPLYLHHQMKDTKKTLKHYRRTWIY